MGKKKIQIWLPLLFAVVMVAGMAIGYKLRDKTQGGKFLRTDRSSALQELVDLVRNRYVDPVKADSINQLAADELLSHLDPHSVFIPARELMQVNEEMMGSFQGIGIEFQIIQDTVHVMNVMKGGPSEKAGVQVGDELIKVNDSRVIAGQQLPSDTIRALLRGPIDSKVKVQVLRNNKLVDLLITRGLIPVPTVDVAYMIQPGTGFIRINKFGERTYEEFMESLEKLQSQGMKELILDLRGNGGGLMKEATDIADEFLSDDKLIVYTEGAHMPRMEYRCKREGLFEKGKLVVLIDETSASASEVLSGALQDWDRATIVGRRSFGKGLVQQQFQLTDGSAVRLTIARYFSPLGRNIQKPYNKGKDAYENELLVRLSNGELMAADTSRPVGKAYKTPGGHTVYGGGGITPDVFVPYDSVLLDTLIAKLYHRSTLPNFTYRQYLKQKTYFDQFKTTDDLVKSYIPGEKEWQELVAFAAKDSIKLAGANAKEKAALLQKVQVVMGRQIWRMPGYFQVLNRTDKTVNQALAVLKN
ncbi:MAG: S41 family peptidase [Chitinophagaceae bacterium]|nr:S41 family peptidase [Chitinophagaceae bacterium]